MRIVLVSDDSNFFVYIIPKLLLRKSDEIYRYGFDNFDCNSELFRAALVVINSENAESKTMDLLEKIKDVPTIVFAYNENPDFMLSAYKKGMNEYLSLLISDEELQAKMVPLFINVSLLEKNLQFREMLHNNKLLLQDSDTYTDYNSILDFEIEKINATSQSAVLAAISTQEKNKAKIKPFELEKILSNNIRKSDVLMKYAINRYFLILHNVNLELAKKIIDNIIKKIPDKIFVGYANILSKKRQQVVDEVLNRLHEAIKYDKDYVRSEKNPIKELGSTNENFKVFKQEFNKKIEQIITPAFYHTQLKYNNSQECLVDVSIENDNRFLQIRTRNKTGKFSITTPGYTKINIDLSLVNNSNQQTDLKRITLEPDELEFVMLTDLLERFMMDFTKGE